MLWDKMLDNVLTQGENIQHCPVCRVLARALYRDKPKGEAANFVCVNCLPVEMIPSDEEQDIILDLHRALKG